MKKPKVIIKRGFEAVKEEEQRREEQRKASQGKLYRVFFPKDADEDFTIPFTFLTAEPTCYYEHTVKINGKITHRTCTGDDCKDCASDNKPRFVGAFLGIDHTHFQIEERDSSGNKTGKKKTIKAKAKLLVRGQQDLAVLDRLNKKKKGLTGGSWEIYKTGKDTSTKWNFDRIDFDDEDCAYDEGEFDLSNKQIQAILPEDLRGKDYYDIVEEQITPTESDYEEDESDSPESDEELRKKVNSKVQRVDDEEEEEETHRRAPRNTRGSKSSSSRKLIKKNK